ncbi:hypothetical protein IT409_00330, partial [Candidatus Falkowbacteria bacterium]|nr:hypothetical protein [Candidatus Falkowbacteria bacterium]
SYSLANHPSDDASIIRFVIKLLPGGLASDMLKDKKVGDTLELRGAGGLFTYKSAEAQKVVLVCTGTGIIPVLSIAEFELQKNTTQPIHLLFGTRYKVDIFWEDYLQELTKKHPNFSYDIILSKPVGYWEGKKGYVTQELKHFTDSRYHYYICGLPQMIEDAKTHLISQGVSPNHIFEEKYISVGLSQEK